MDQGQANTALTPLQTIGILIALIPGLAPLLYAGHVLGVGDFMFIGFIFVTFWMGVQHAAPQEFAPALLGCFAGLAQGFALKVVPAEYGTAGAVIGGLSLALTLYLLIRKQMPLLFNQAFALTLAVAASFSFDAAADYVASGIALGLCGAYAGGLVLLGKVMAARKASRLAANSAA